LNITVDYVITAIGRVPSTRQCEPSRHTDGLGRDGLVSNVCGQCSIRHNTNANGGHIAQPRLTEGHLSGPPTDVKGVQYDGASSGVYIIDGYGDIGEHVKPSSVLVGSIVK